MKLDAAAVERLTARVQREVDEGHSTAAQFAIGLDDEIVAGASFGTATDDTRFVIYSATKTIVAMALLPHFASGALDLLAPVARYIPSFEGNGKADVTVLQVLTMQGGFPQAPMGPEAWGTSAGRRETFASWRLDWPAGTRTEYHPVAAHWVIAELIETLGGTSYLDAVHEAVTGPAGAPPLLGPRIGGPVATVRVAGSVPADRAPLVATFGREDLVPDTTIGPEALLLLNIPEAQAAGIPGGGAVARATDIATVYQSFLHDRAGAFDPRWLADATGTVRNVSINQSDGTPANRTIAGIVAGSDGYHRHRWFPDAPRAFGHMGAGAQVCWLEPQRGLSFCFLHDTLQQDPRHDFDRSDELNSLAIATVQP